MTLSIFFLLLYLGLVIPVVTYKKIVYFKKICPGEEEITNNYTCLYFRYLTPEH